MECWPPRATSRGAVATTEGAGGQSRAGVPTDEWLPRRALSCFESSGLEVRVRRVTPRRGPFEEEETGARAEEQTSSPRRADRPSRSSRARTTSLTSNLHGPCVRIEASKAAPTVKCDDSDASR